MPDAGRHRGQGRPGLTEKIHGFQQRHRVGPGRRGQRPDHPRIAALFLGLVQLAPRPNPYLGRTAALGAERLVSEATAQTIDAEVLRITDECHAEALRLLREHRAELDALVAALLARDTLDETEILEVTRLPRSALRAVATP